MRVPRSVDLRRLRITAPGHGAARPARIELDWPTGHASAVVDSTGRIQLARDVSAREFAVRVLAAAPAGAAAVGIGELTAPGLPRMRVPRSGRVGGCGDSAVLAAGTRVPLRVTSNIRDLDAGRPLRAVGCERLSLPAGRQRVRIPAQTLRPDNVLLGSPAPSPIAHASTTAGRVTDAGDPGRGSRDDVRLDVHAPSWLVLGESYDRGWRAWCNGRGLGAPLPLDGYANAWPVEPGCRTARFAFAPQRPVHIVQLLSALACLLPLAIAIAPRIRRRDPQPLDAFVHADWPDAPPGRTALPRAALAGLIAGGALAFCFSLRSGVLIAPAVALVLWRGIPALPLAITGGLLLAVAVPLDYVMFPAPDFGGYNPGYAGDQVSGHWLAVAAWVLLALALWRVLSTASRRRGGPSGAPADAAE